MTWIPSNIIFADQEESFYVIEMQIAGERYFFLRMIFYVGRVWTDQIETGNKYNLLKGVGFILVTDFDVFPHYDINKVIGERNIMKCVHDKPNEFYRSFEWISEYKQEMIKRMN